MKKQNMFKVILFTILALVVLTWLVPTGTASGTEVITEGLSRIGLVDLIQIPLGNYTYFCGIAFFVIAVSVLYGVLAKSGKYTLAVNKLAKSLKGKERVTLIVTTVIFALLTALCGFNITSFVFIPLVVTVLITMGYDRMVGFLATFGATILGTIGSIYNESVTGFINQIVNVPDYNTNIIAKIALLVVTLVVYIFFVDKYAASVKKSATRSVLDEGKVDVFELATPAKKGSLGMYIVLGLFALVVLLGVLPWEGAWKIDFFTNITNKVLSFEIGGHAIFKYLLGDVSAFGSYGFEQVVYLVVFATVIVALVSKMNFETFRDGVVEGLKKAIAPAAAMLLAYTVLILSVYYPVFTTIEGWIVGWVDKFNALGVLTTSLATVLGTILSVDTIYSAQQVLPMLATAYAENTAIIGLIFQAIHGVTLFLAPTSLVLILGLEYYNIPYKTWFKFALKTVLEILVVVLIILLALFLI